jgi:CubicO group peptidase (beta-lactamase class C family)
MGGWRLDDVITKEHILKMVRNQKELNFEPGQENLHSNTGYTLLAVIVERVSGQSFPSDAEKRVVGFRLTRGRRTQPSIR